MNGSDSDREALGKGGSSGSGRKEANEVREASARRPGRLDVRERKLSSGIEARCPRFSAQKRRLAARAARHSADEARVPRRETKSVVPAVPRDGKVVSVALESLGDNAFAVA